MQEDKLDAEGQKERIRNYRAFMSTHANTLVGERARLDWMRQLALEKKWGEFHNERSLLGLGAKDQEMLCYAAMEHLTSENYVAQEAARLLWLTPGTLPDGCHTMGEALMKVETEPAYTVWQRLRLLYDAGEKEAFVQGFDRWVRTNKTPPRLLKEIESDPKRFFQRTQSSASRSQNELGLWALQLWARQDPLAAGQYWNSYGKQLFSKEYADWGQLQIACQAARRLLPQAIAWFRSVPASTLTPNCLEWWARISLRFADWGSVLQAIDAMPIELRLSPGWTWWRARALQQQGRAPEAIPILQALSHQDNYHGILASDALGKPPSFPTATPIGEKERLAAKQNPHLFRALYFNRLELKVPAQREWEYAIRGMDDRSLLAAAELAAENNWWERSIFTANRTVYLHNFNLRYPTPYANEVKLESRILGMDAAWIYGLIRQESRFAPDARSVAGAAGLMQLMPRTAQWVANTNKISEYKPSKVHEISLNIEIGTKYLRTLYYELGSNPVLATVGYNAGPGRARAWRAKHTLDPTVYIETIPWNEPRDYVRKVLSASAYYRAQESGKPVSLTPWLLPISPIQDGEKIANVP